MVPKTSRQPSSRQGTRILPMSWEGDQAVHIRKYASLAGTAEASIQPRDRSSTPTDILLYYSLV